jgi:ferredoxin
VDDLHERVLGGLRVRIDRTLCVGFGDCVEAAPDAFELDSEGIATFLAPGAGARDRLVNACESCPVDALTLWDEQGAQIVP